MYFSRLTINPSNMDAKELARQVCADSYHEHQQLWNIFDAEPDSKRDFLFRREQVQGWPSYYVVSERLPETRQKIWTVEHKNYQPKITAGQQLAFRLRVNPVVTVTTKQGKKQRHDVVMNLKKKLDFNKLSKRDRPPEIELVQQAGIEWLLKRAEAAGFSFQQTSVLIDGYMQHKVFKKKQKQAIRYSSLDYEGVLTVMDVEKFASALFHGIGRSKAFGCGLLLIKRI